MNVMKLLVLIGLSTVILIGCSEGPAEKTGKKLDNAVENVQDKLQNKGPAQKAGEKLDEATGN